MAKKKKKIPTRLCIGCQNKKPKRELVRVVRTPENEIKLDRSGKVNGRGVYLCTEVNCLNEAFKKKRFQKSLKRELKNTEKAEIETEYAEILDKDEE